MKPFFKVILKYYLKYITKLMLLIHRPEIIAIAGSTNKAFTKNEIRKQLEAEGKNVWANSKSLNTEIGLPLSILRIPSGYGSYGDWLPVLVQSVSALWQKNYPKYLVLELGVSRPGDMKYLLSIVQPRISVVTDITQRYLESFSGMDDLVGEYRLLVEKTPKRSLVILNNDNNRVRELASFSKAKVLSFGHFQDADVIVSAVEREGMGEIATVVYNNKEEKQHIPAFGLHNVYARLVSIIVKNNI